MEVLFIDGYQPLLLRKDQVAGAYTERTNHLVLLMVNSSTPVRIPMSGPASAESTLQAIRTFLEAR